MTNDEYKAKYLNILTEGYFRFRDLVIVEENKLIFRNDKLLWERILYIIIGIVGNILIAFQYFIFKIK